MEYLRHRLTLLCNYFTRIWNWVYSIVKVSSKEEAPESEIPDFGYLRHRTSRSPIRRKLRPSSLNPLGPMDPPLVPLLKVGEDKESAKIDFIYNSLRLPKEIPSPDFNHEHRGSRRKKTLVLDLDETLVYASIQSSKSCEFITEVFIDGRSSLYYVHRRPYLDTFLDAVSNWYHLAIYTASIREYADVVVSWIDNGRRLFKKRLFRKVYF
jgi:hypothetical protein